VGISFLIETFNELFFDRYKKSFSLTSEISSLSLGMVFWISDNVECISITASVNFL